MAKNSTKRKRRSHRFVISITMDKPCTKSHALRELRDNIHGTFYPTQFEDSDPGEFRVRAFRNLKREDSER